MRSNKVFRKISEKWHKKYKKRYKMMILDPDGWDRNNFDYSWFEEKITWKEFIKRSLISSQIPIR